MSPFQIVAGWSFTICNAVLRGTSIKTLIKEIRKCDVLCVNCHAKLHWRETHETDSWEEVRPSEELRRAGEEIRTLGRSFTKRVLYR